MGIILSFLLAISVITLAVCEHNALIYVKNDVKSKRNFIRYIAHIGFSS